MWLCAWHTTSQKWPVQGELQHTGTVWHGYMSVLQMQNPSKSVCIWSAPPEYTVHGVEEGVWPPPIQHKHFISMCLALHEGTRNAETGNRHQGNSGEVVAAAAAAQGVICREDPSTGVSKRCLHHCLWALFLIASDFLCPELISSEQASCTDDTAVYHILTQYFMLLNWLTPQNHKILRCILITTTSLTGTAECCTFWLSLKFMRQVIHTSSIQNEVSETELCTAQPIHIIGTGIKMKLQMSN